ncbi:lipopolysaccharide exporter periplasmic protein [Thiorhodovibrio winogradskyi]|uniref:Lipopolysaccharide exporter periplasmic protein n=1 Tax=Thiorhodovibrio winogradskyi TaxID=77007 RepID=A0ABZ0S7G2_9GAMM|nr:LPS export ABC transporter periplasmic protein LptC [Thiorhodovibrio winogradskyi]
MFAYRRQSLLAATLLLLGTLALWFSQPTQDTVQPQSTLENRRPDYIVEGVRALELDSQGQPLRQLHAEQLRHYPDDDSSELDQPRLVLYDQALPPWRIRSERGWIAAGSEQIVLTGDVRANRAQAPAHDPLAFSTSQIKIFPDDRYVETDRFVELDRGLEHMTAIDGMRLWYSEPMRGEFLGRVRSRLSTSETPAPPRPPATSADRRLD